MNDWRGTNPPRAIDFLNGPKCAHGFPCWAEGRPGVACGDCAEEAVRWARAGGPCPGCKHPRHAPPRCSELVENGFRGWAPCPCTYPDDYSTLTAEQAVARADAIREGARKE